MLLLIIMTTICRWASDDAMGRQPEFLKFVFNFILNAFEEFERELRPEGRSYDVEATIEEVTNETLFCVILFYAFGSLIKNIAFQNSHFLH